MGKPGDQLIFKINAEYPDIAAKLTSPNYTELARFLSQNGLYINTTGHPDWMDTLYPQAKSTDLQSGLLYTFPQKTYPADYPSNESSDCMDLELGVDIENHTISYRNHPRDWADWSGYTCKYYSQDACEAGHATKTWNSSGWGPFQFFYNGHIKNGTGHGPNNGTNLRAHE